MSQILRLAVPLTVWLAGFSALYALHGLTCSRHWPSGLEGRPVLIMAGSLLFGVEGVLLWLILRIPAASRFVQWVATCLAVVALASSIWTWVPVLALAGCR